MRCTISIKNDDGSITSTYCHTGGELLATGRMLYENYQSYKKIEHLLSFGHIQSLQKNIDIPKDVIHTLESPAKDISSFIRRDSAEKLTQFQSTTFDSLYEYKKDFLFEENNYFFNYVEKLWYVFDPVKDQFKELGKALLAMADELPPEDIALIEKQQDIYQQLKDSSPQKEFSTGSAPRSLPKQSYKLEVRDDTRDIKRPRITK